MNCDPDAARELRDHLSEPEEQRGAKWRHRFYDLVETACMRERDPRIFVGPDGFPYFALDVPDDDEEPGTTSVGDLLNVATERGFGIAISPSDEEAAWVFTYGDLLTRRVFGSWEFPRIGVPAKEEPTFRNVLKDAEQLTVTAPPERLLPSYARPLLYRYFTQMLEIADPGVLALVSPEQEPPEQLVFRLSRGDFDDDASFEAALAGITWFLPRHLVVSVLPGEVIDALSDEFVPLEA